ncbi:MAG: hypothetical protein IH840_16035 [Candidatus Heimdallarchaeota archaeon]|nr:hypothetical protein [Candidatus Heimdallarchaeota archaeon]
MIGNSFIKTTLLVFLLILFFGGSPYSELGSDQQTTPVSIDNQPAG